jgi:hypothetical protein
MIMIFYDFYNLSLIIKDHKNPCLTKIYHYWQPRSNGNTKDTLGSILF